MAVPSRTAIQDPVLGGLLFSGDAVWEARVRLKPGESTLLRIIREDGGPLEERVRAARQPLAWIRSHSLDARLFAARGLLKDHNERRKDGRSIDAAAFADRLRLKHVTLAANCTLLQYHDGGLFRGVPVGVILGLNCKLLSARTVGMLPGINLPTLQRPPFPKLELSDDTWCGQIVLPSWAGVPAKEGRRGSASLRRRSRGRVDLSVSSAAEAPDQEPSAEQTRAFQFLLTHQELIQRRMLPAILRWYRTQRPEYLEVFPENEEAMPDIRRPEELRRLIQLHTIHVLEQTFKGAAYVGFQLHCTWDQEHGLGVLTHGSRIVEVGGADTSFDGGSAGKDARARR